MLLATVDVGLWVRCCLGNFINIDLCFQEIGQDVKLKPKDRMERPFPVESTGIASKKR